MTNTLFATLYSFVTAVSPCHREKGQALEVNMSHHCRAEIILQCRFALCAMRGTALGANILQQLDT